MRYPSVVAIFTLAAVGYYPAWALDVVGFNAATNSRFSSGFPSAPVSNPSGSFIGAGFDFSGVGWEAASTDFAVTMISPQNFVTAAHVAPGASSTVDFFSQDGVLRPYTVASTSSILYNGQTSDLVVGTLSTAIPASDHVAYYPILYIGTPLSTINLSGYTVPTLLVYGKTGTIGTNTIDGFVNGDLNNNGIVESFWF